MYCHDQHLLNLQKWSGIMPAGLNDSAQNASGTDHRTRVPTYAAKISEPEQMSLSRREICALLPMLFQVTKKAVQGQDSSLSSGAFQFEQLPLHIANNNAQIRNVMRGKLATGEGIEVHETTLPPAGTPTATTHHHPHSEMWLVREGTIELTVNGKTYPLEPGSIGFACSNDEHGIRNIGSTAAIYFLIAVGPGAELQT